MTAPEAVKQAAEVLAEHRVNYHQRNVGPEPVTADNLRYTSCDGCDWLGGHRNEAGWERHLAALIAAREAAAVEAERERLADDLLTDWAVEVGQDNAAGIADWIRAAQPVQAPATRQLMSEPHDGHAADETCPGCPHVQAPATTDGGAE